MANTILEKLQEKYPNAEGINDARNIAEAMACISGTGGRGANAIADHTWAMHSVIYMPNGATGQVYAKTIASITPADLSAPTNWTPPEGKIFAGWGESANTTSFHKSPYYLSQGESFYAIWKDSITLSFDANGGSGEMDPIAIPKDSTYYNFPECGFTPPEGKIFAGWGLTAEGPAIAQPGPAYGEVSNDLPLYAIWQDAE